MADPYRVSTTSFDSQGSLGGDVTLNKPAGATTGDVLVAHVTVKQSTTSPIVPPSGWTEAYQAAVAGATGGSAIRSATFYRTVGVSGEPTSYTFTHDYGYRYGSITLIRDGVVAGVSGASASHNAPRDHTPAAVTLSGSVTGGLAVVTEHCAFSSGAYTAAGWTEALSTAGGEMRVFERTIASATGTYTPPTLTDADTFNHNYVATAVVFKPAVTAPANDNFANAATVTIPTAGSTYTSSPIDSSLATTEPGGEPDGGLSSSSRSLWWKYTPTADGVATFDTVGSFQTANPAATSADTQIGLYTGSALNALTRVASDGDSGGSHGGKQWTSWLQYNVTAGTTYYLQVGTYVSQPNVTYVVNVTGPATTSGPTVPETTGSVTGSGTVSATRTPIGITSGTTSGTGAVSGTASGIPEVSGPVNGSGVISATTSVVGEPQSVVGTVEGSGLISGISTAVQDRSGSVSGVGQVSGAVIPVRTISGSVSGSGTISAVVEVVGSTPPGDEQVVDLSTYLTISGSPTYDGTKISGSPLILGFGGLVLDPTQTYTVEIDYTHNGSEFNGHASIHAISAPGTWDGSFEQLGVDDPILGTGTSVITIGPGLDGWDASVVALGEVYVAFQFYNVAIRGIRISPPMSAGGGETIETRTGYVRSQGRISGEAEIVIIPSDDEPLDPDTDESSDPQDYNEFAKAMFIDYDYGGEELTLRYGTVEPGEPTPPATVATSWMTWIAEEDDEVIFHLLADPAGVEFTGTIYAGSWDNKVTEISGTNEFKLTVQIEAGTQYWLQIAAGTSELDVEVSWSLGPTTVEPSDRVDYLRVEVYEADGLELITELPRRLAPSGQEPLNEAGMGEITVHLEDEILKAYPDLLEFGNIVKFWLARKCISGFRIRGRKTSYIASGEWAGYVRTVSGPTVTNLLDDFIVRHDLPGSLQDRTLQVRPFTWAAPPGSWFEPDRWEDPYNTNTQTDPPSDFGKPPKQRSKWNNPPDFPDKAAKWMWIHPVPEKNENNFDPPPLRGLRYYRRTFWTDKKMLVRLYASADEAYTVYLDGEEVISGSGEETGYTQLEKRKLILNPGQHTVGIVQHFNAQVMADGADAVIFTLMKVNDKNKPTDVIIHSDENWMCSHERPVPSWRRTNVLRKVVNEARDRGNDAANLLTFGFTEERDSHNRRWTDYWNREVEIGTTALELAKLLAEGNGFDFWVDPETLEIMAWRRRGRDKSDSVALEAGKNLIDYEVEEIEEVRNTFLINYDKGWTTWRAKGSRRRFGAREAFVEMGRARGDNHSQQIMQKAARGVGWAAKRAGVSDLRKRQADQPSGSVIAVPGARPFLDFGVGDIIKAPNENGVLRRHRVVMLSFTEDENGNLTFDPELEEL